MCATSSFTCVGLTFALLATFSCGKPSGDHVQPDRSIPLIETASQGIYSPTLPWTWEASLPELALNPPRNLMSEQALEPGVEVSTVAPIASPYVYVLEGQLDSAIPAFVELRLASEYGDLEKAHQHRIFRAIPAFDGRFQISFFTYPSEKIIQLFVSSGVPAYLQRAVLRMAQDAQDLRMLGGFYGYTKDSRLDQWRRYIALDGEVKTALLFPGSATAQFSVTIPQKSVLHTHYAVMASNGFRSLANFHLEFIADGMKKGHRLCSAQILAQTRTQLGRWLSMTCDLKDIIGKHGHLVFRTEAAEGERPLLLWGTPTLFRKGKPRPNLLVITVDSLRSDRMSGADDARDTTPFMSRLTRESVFFPQFIVPSSASELSLISMLYSQRNVRRFEMQDPTSRSGHIHLMEHLQRYGYLTEILGDFKPNPDLDHGGDPTREVARYPGDRALLEQGLTLLRSHQGAQQALWLHLQGPSNRTQLDETHRHFFEEDGAFFSRAPEFDGIPIWKEKIKLLPSERARIVLDYDRRLRQTDDELHRFFERAQSERLLEDTLIVLTANHGVDLFAHNPYNPGAGVLFDTVLRVPMIWMEPQRSKLQAAKRVEVPMGGIDLSPTILDYFGIPAPIEFQGESVLPLVIGASALQRFHLSLQPCTTSDGIFSFRSTHHKLIVNPSNCQAQDPEGYAYAPGGELYDLLADPQETQNLYEREPELVLFLKRHLTLYRLKTDVISGSKRTLNSSFNTVQEMTGNVP